EDFGGAGFNWASSPEARAKLWEMRHSSYWTVLKLRPGATGVVTDICVPMSELADAVEAAAADLKAVGLIGMIVGHVGDGNFHATMLVDPASAEEVKDA